MLNCPHMTYVTGKLCVKQGNYDEGEQKFQQSLAIRENVLGKSHPDIANDLGEYNTYTFHTYVLKYVPYTYAYTNIPLYL